MNLVERLLTPTKNAFCPHVFDVNTHKRTSTLVHNDKFALKQLSILYPRFIRWEYRWRDRCEPSSPQLSRTVALHVAHLAFCACSVILFENIFKMAVAYLSICSLLMLVNEKWERRCSTVCCSLNAGVFYYFILFCWIVSCRGPYSLLSVLLVA